MQQTLTQAIDVLKKEPLEGHQTTQGIVDLSSGKPGSLSRRYPSR